MLCHLKFTLAFLSFLSSVCLGADIAKSEKIPLPSPPPTPAADTSQRSGQCFPSTWLALILTHALYPNVPAGEIISMLSSYHLSDAGSIKVKAHDVEVGCYGN